MHRSSVNFRGGICRYKTFCMRIVALRTFLRLNVCFVNIFRKKLSLNAVFRSAHTAGASGIAHERRHRFLTPKKKENRKFERGEFITPPRLRQAE